MKERVAYTKVNLIDKSNTLVSSLAKMKLEVKF